MFMLALTDVKLMLEIGDILYLEIVLDQYLNFETHIEKLTKQIVRAAGIL